MPYVAGPGEFYTPRSMVRTLVTIFRFPNWQGHAVWRYTTFTRIGALSMWRSNGHRNRLWKFELQKLANEIHKDIQVLHYPSGTSKWNKIEHHLFAFISRNWRGIPLVSASIIVHLIGATKTEKGLSIACVLDEAAWGLLTIKRAI
jgi:hypothetical protein